ncbi:hypothetical protein HPP92_018622 [Vanilla planifolia]|uniref:Cullin family profile domain-containing protein n=1 Tax=Vanilla planifolia TaxID=51239 RepID=A0A835QD77_VANPL|nr:hypothetical protein HPP92_018622 [Vanilla planifolia]
MAHAKRPFYCSTASSGGVLEALFAFCFSLVVYEKGKNSADGIFVREEKNGVHRHNFDAPLSVGEEDEEAMLIDQDEIKGVASSSAIATTGVASNLSRKKATPQPKKQLVIKLSKGKPTLPTNFEEDTWATLKCAIIAIFLKRQDPCDSEKLYQAVSDLCLHKLGGSLYRHIQNECEGHISAKIRSLVGQSLDLVVFLSLVEKCWQDFCDQMLMIREVESKIVAGLLELIEHERLGEAIERTVVGHLLKMFTALGTYTESFEKPFLERTSDFYASEGVKYMQQLDVADYLKHVELRLQEEHERWMLYLDANTRKPLVSTTEKQLLERHTSAILDKGFTVLMDAKRVDDLKRLYILFTRNRPAELVAKFLDEKLRAGNKGTSEEELEGTLDRVLVLFRFIQGKDVFEAFYKKDLAKRLLLGKSASIDAEKSMISKLKTECGSQFTNKLEGMFKDIELSKEINDSFFQAVISIQDKTSKWY